MATSGDAGDHVEEVRQVKLPPFWQVDPVLWFAQVEAQFYAYKVRADTSKYFTVVASLDSAVLQKVSDIVRNPPETGKYEVLKKQMIARFSDSRAQQVRKLVSELELGDRTPSQLLREMKALAQDSMSEEILRTLWAQRLPTNIQEILSSCESTALDALATMADKIAEVAGQGTRVSAIRQPCQATAELQGDAGSSEPSTLAALQRQVAELTRMVEKLSQNSDRPQRPRSRNRSRSREGNTLCYFHRKFGARAWRCQNPCSWREAHEASEN